MNMTLLPVSRGACIGAALALMLATCPAGAHDGHRHENRPALRGMAPPAGVRIGGEFELIDQDGRPFRIGAPSGRPTLLFFGFTSCPAVCPTALADAQQVRSTLGPELAPTVVFITLDPQRDTPQVLKAYVGAFDPEFIGLGGSPEQVERAARGYRVGYRRVTTGASYTIDHSAFTYLLDERGRVVRLYPHGTPGIDLAEDLSRLRQHLRADAK